MTLPPPLSGSDGAGGGAVRGRGSDIMSEMRSNFPWTEVDQVVNTTFTGRPATNINNVLFS